MPNDSASDTKPGLGTGAKVGIGIGVAAAIAIVLVLLFMFLKNSPMEMPGLGISPHHPSYHGK